MGNELLETAKFLIGFSRRILFLLLPTDSIDRLVLAIAIGLTVSVVVSWKRLRSGFILEWGSFSFFLIYAVSLYFSRWNWLAEHMGVIASVFLSGLVWITVLSGKPFTLQYARADLPREQWNEEGLIRCCQVIAMFWGTILFVPVAAAIFRSFFPAALPAPFYFFLSPVCIGIGALFTFYYKSLKQKQRAIAEGASPESDTRR
jgi:carotenoid cleavage dioxygenase